MIAARLSLTRRPRDFRSAMRSAWAGGGAFRNASRCADKHAWNSAGAAISGAGNAGAFMHGPFLRAFPTRCLEAVLALDRRSPGPLRDDSGASMADERVRAD